MKWGLLGPEVLMSQRRMRTLGLGTVVRKFNDLAVPGMGGIWFGKQLLIATLGVVLAERARTNGRQYRNIEVANAVEAIACWLALDENQWQGDLRLLGRLKMQGKVDLSFRRVRQYGFYVTQPMRMRTVQPLLALGLVEGTSERFNAFKSTEIAQTFIETACEDYRPNNRTVLSNLICWMLNDDDCIKTGQSRQALSPIQPLKKGALEILRERIVHGSKGVGSRRKNLLDWMNKLREAPKQQIMWSRKPPSLDDDHWRDIRVGAHFFATRDAAIDVLDNVEMHLGNNVGQQLSLTARLNGRIQKSLNTLRGRAQSFLEQDYDPSPGELAKIFCQECDQPDMRSILKSLVVRDGRVLQLRGDRVVPGTAFRGTQVISENEDDPQDEGEGSGLSTDILWPEGISVRVQNLFLMNADLCGDLDGWLNSHNRSGSSVNA